MAEDEKFLLPSGRRLHKGAEGEPLDRVSCPASFIDVAKIFNERNLLRSA
jgi:hypothetical protein